MPAPTMRFMLCAQIADALASFAGQQEKSFNEWRLTQEQGARWNLGTLMMALENYDASSGRISLHDSLPRSGYGSQSSTYYHQKDACVEAFKEACSEVVGKWKDDGVCLDREALIKSVREVVVQPIIDAQLTQYFTELSERAKLMEEKFTPLLGRGPAANIPGLCRLSLAEFEVEMRKGAALPQAVVELGNQFFRELHVSCEKRRDAPAYERDSLQSLH